jgi:exodeoxyribonuclease-3
MSLNCNGIRAAARKGYFDWLAASAVDVVCLQETKAQREQLDDPVFFPKGFYCYYFDAQKKGYSGTALYTRVKPDKVQAGLGWPIADDEGRYIQADFGELSIASLYLPSGSSGEDRQARKMDFMARFLEHLRQLAADGRRYIICGDWNICHKEIDLKNWKSNQKNSGFLPEERQWLDILYDELGLVDAFRLVNKSPEQYSWWSARGQARAKNVGWRLDYHVISPELADAVEQAEIYTEQQFSDHAPVTLRYNLRFG